MTDVKGPRPLRGARSAPLTSAIRRRFSISGCISSPEFEDILPGRLQQLPPSIRKKSLETPNTLLAAALVVTLAPPTEAQPSSPSQQSPAPATAGAPSSAKNSPAPAKAGAPAGVHIPFVEGKPFAEVLRRAKAEGKPVMLDVVAEWCGPCKIMDRTTFSDPAVVDWSKGAIVPARVDAEKGEGRRIAARYQAYSFPTVLFLDADGNEIDRLVGGSTPSDFRRAGEAILNGRTPILEGLAKLKASWNAGEAIAIASALMARRDLPRLRPIALRIVGEEGDLSRPEVLQLFLQLVVLETLQNDQSVRDGRSHRDVSSRARDGRTARFPRGGARDGPREAGRHRVGARRDRGHAQGPRRGHAVLGRRRRGARRRRAPGRQRPGGARRLSARRLARREERRLPRRRGSSGSSISPRRSRRAGGRTRRRRRISRRSRSAPSTRRSPHGRPAPRSR